MNVLTFADPNEPETRDSSKKKSLIRTLEKFDKSLEREKIALHLPQLKKRSHWISGISSVLFPFHCPGERKVSPGYIRLENGARNSEDL